MGSVSSQDSDADDKDLGIEGVQVVNDNATSEIQEHVAEGDSHSDGSSVRSESLDLESTNVDDTVGGPPEVENASKETNVTSTGEDPITLFTIESARSMFKKWKADRVPSHELVYSIDIPREDPRTPSEGSVSRSRYFHKSSVAPLGGTVSQLLLFKCALKAEIEGTDIKNYKVYSLYNITLQYLLMSFLFKF